MRHTKRTTSLFLGAGLLAACSASTGDSLTGSAPAASTAEPLPLARVNFPPERTVTLPPHSDARPRGKTISKVDFRVAPDSYNGGGFATLSTPTKYVTANQDSVAIYNDPRDAQPTDFATNQGGPTIQNAQIEMIFWGTNWQTAANASSADVVNATNKIVASTYLASMAQYGLQSTQIHEVVKVASDPPASFDFDDVGDMVSILVEAGALPPPSAGQFVYMVYMPQSATYNGTTPPARGSHGTYGLPLGGYARVAWSGYGNLSFITDVSTHELVESLSDPDTGLPAWVMNRTINGGDEIGDACNNTADYFDGMFVQAYWSQAQRACVIPFQPAPTVQTLSPASGLRSGNTTVHIGGANFDTLGGTKVFFGGVAATGVGCSSSTSCSATTPPGVGTVAVSVTVNHFTSAPSQAVFAYDPIPPTCSVAIGATCGAVTFTCPAGPDSTSYEWLDPSTGTWGSPIVLNGSTAFELKNPETVRFCAGNTAGLACGAAQTVTPNLTGLFNSCAGVGGSKLCGNVPDQCGGTFYCGACPPPPTTCDGVKKPTSGCSVGWRCCGLDGWACGVCQ